MADAVRAGTADEGDWLVALRQTAGRGRQGREWFDGTGNFMGSTVVELHSGDPPAATLSFVAALAVSQAIGTAIVGAAPVRLKWPNDVLIDGGKASGILLEMIERKVVIGIGVNLACAPDLPDRRTSALADFAPLIAPEAFVRRLAMPLREWLIRWRVEGFAAVLREFVQGTGYSQGTALIVHDSDGSRVSGTFLGLEESDGALRLLLADGSQRVIRAGDVL